MNTIPSDHAMTDSNKALMKRCRLVLIVTADQLETLGDNAPALLEAAGNAGDIASIIFAQKTLDDAPFLELVRPCVEAVQAIGIAAVIAGDARVANRLSADGIQFGQDPQGIAEGVERFAPKIMIGAGNIRTRHNALIIGEKQPDYLMFGKPGGDTHHDANPKNLDLGEWWAAMIEIPCIVLGGRSLDSVVEVAKRGVEFVALSSAIFTPEDDDTEGRTRAEAITERVRLANELLDKHAPVFEEIDD